jgi:hypothetical protein
MENNDRDINEQVLKTEKQKPGAPGRKFLHGKTGQTSRKNSSNKKRIPGNWKRLKPV